MGNCVSMTFAKTVLRATHMHLASVDVERPQVFTELVNFLGGWGPVTPPTTMTVLNNLKVSSRRVTNPSQFVWEFPSLSTQSPMSQAPWVPGKLGQLVTLTSSVAK